MSVEIEFRKRGDGAMVAICPVHKFHLTERCWFLCDMRTDTVHSGPGAGVMSAAEQCEKERRHPRALFCHYCNAFVGVREFSPPHRVIRLDSGYDVIGEHLKSFKKKNKTCPTCGGSGHVV
jgi:hypothetical protein